MTLVLRATSLIETPPPGTPQIAKPAIVSDSFSGPDQSSILGRVTDSYAGGGPGIWEGATADTIGVTDGTARRNTNTGLVTVGLPILTPDVEIQVELLDSATPIDYLDIRRATMNGSPLTGYRLYIAGWGKASEFHKRVDGTSSTIGDGPVTNRGDTIIFGVNADLLYVGVNGTITHTVTDQSIPGAGYVGFSGGSTRDPIIGSIRVLPARAV